MPGLAPHEIETRSMEIIDSLLPPHAWPPGELAVVKRLVHTSGDPSLAEYIRFSSGAVEAGVAALRGGAPVFTDVNMVRTGINTARLDALGSACTCHIGDPVIAAQSRETGATRATLAMRTFGPRLHGAIVAIGNAPTALREVLALAETGIRPALVIGIPVGFVDAAESKDALMLTDLPYITVAGTRGGSPLAAAAVNALLRLVE